MLFVTGTDASIVNKYGANKGKFSLVNNITSEYYVLEETLNLENLKNFIETHRFPGVPKFSRGTAERIFLSEEPSLILFSNGDASAEEGFKEAAKEL
mmetsp:Transcript_402/g.383  ORF Transcript_402/g.383 Transcript_402/m.383 type:complete len:97 (-) Transcript_402:674-964(-)